MKQNLSKLMTQRGQKLVAIWGYQPQAKAHAAKSERAKPISLRRNTKSERAKPIFVLCALLDLSTLTIADEFQGKAVPGKKPFRISQKLL